MDRMRPPMDGLSVAAFTLEHIQPRRRPNRGRLDIAERASEGLAAGNGRSPDCLLDCKSSLRLHRPGKLNTAQFLRAIHKRRVRRKRSLLQTAGSVAQDASASRADRRRTERMVE